MSSPPRQLKHILPPKWRETIKSWLAEDMPSFDVGGYVVGDRVQTATLYGKSAGILAGVPFFEAVFDELGCTVEWLLTEGDAVVPIAEVAKVTGPVNRLLLGERTALNILARASGIASVAATVAAAAKAAGWHGEVAGTRKTTPGFRLVEKYALLVGGVSTHRYDVSSMVMLKDNHIWSTGSVTEAVKAARSVCGFSMKVEVEARSLDEAREAAAAGADIVMLDNRSPEQLSDMAKALKTDFPHVIVEGSGGITPDTIAAHFSPFVDVLSLGKLTQGYPVVDYSLKLPRPESAAK